MCRASGVIAPILTGNMLQKYHDVDIDVVRKDGLILIREMAAEVKNMLDFKMSAVMVSIIIKLSKTTCRT